MIKRKRKNNSVYNKEEKQEGEKNQIDLEHLTFELRVFEITYNGVISQFLVINVYICAISCKIAFRIDCKSRAYFFFYDYFCYYCTVTSACVWHCATAVVAEISHEIRVFPGKLSSKDVFRRLYNKSSEIWSIFFFLCQASSCIIKIYICNC